jgi:hypothetical protein
MMYPFYFFYLVSDENDVTVTFCGNDTHLGYFQYFYMFSTKPPPYLVVNFNGVVLSCAFLRRKKQNSVIIQ